MSIILDQAKKLERVIIRIDTLVQREGAKHSKFIEEMNREQLLSGKKSTGEDMPDYVDNSKQPSAPGKITLFDEGLFHKGISSLFDNQGIELIGTDSKTGFLVAKYAEALGLIDTNIGRLQDRMIPGLLLQIELILN